MKKSIKLFGFAFALLALVGCTQSFCTNTDRANMILNYATKEVEQDGQKITQWEKSIDNIENKGIIIPNDIYFDFIEEKVYEYAINPKEAISSEIFGEKCLNEYTVDELKNAYGLDASNNEVAFNKSSYYAVIKFVGHDENSEDVAQTLWKNFDTWTEEAKTAAVGKKSLIVNSKTYNFKLDDVPTTGFITELKNEMNQAINLTTACITPESGVFDGIQLQGKSWGDAFNLGLIEGLLEYPIAWMLNGFYNSFSNLEAWGAVLAIFIVTIIVRGFLLLVTFKSTMSQTKMQELQPQLRAIQEKYPNSNTNEYQKNQMAQEQMALYKKNKINPFSSLLVMIVQFPIFIAVWGAMSGSAILRVDTLFEGAGSLWELKLSAAMNNVILSGNIAGIILFVVMSAVQILSAKLPMWLQRRDAKKETNKIGKNPAADQSQKQMNMISNVMMIMIIFMGFTLPVGMAIYWFISAIISLSQSLIMRKITKNKRNKSNFTKYKTK